MRSERRSALIAEAGRHAEEMMRGRLDPLGDRDLTLDEIEDLVEAVGRETDVWLEQRLIEEQSPPASNSAVCPGCQKPARFKRTIQREVLTTHGIQPVEHRYHYCSACRKGFSPAADLLGLASDRSATRRLQAWMARFGAQEASFAAVPPILAELRGLVISESTVERTTVKVGEALAEAIQSAVREQEAGVDPELEAGKQEGEGAVTAGDAGVPRLYAAMDGTMCPLRDEWKKDGSLGKLQCRYGEAKVGMLFTTGHKEGLDTGVKWRVSVGTLLGIAHFTVLMLWLARTWQAWLATELIVLGDGAAWIWTLVGRHFPHAVQILDLWHLLERLWQVAEARFGSRQTAAARGWVALMRDYLEKDEVDNVISSITCWAPVREAHRKLRAEQLGFLENNRERMKYGSYLKKGYMVGSGVMEARCKQVVQSRLHEAGMHWREATAEAVLTIRTHLHGTRPADLRAYA